MAQPRYTHHDHTQIRLAKEERNSMGIKLLNAGNNAIAGRLTRILCGQDTRNDRVSIREKCDIKPKYTTKQEDERMTLIETEEGRDLTHTEQKRLAQLMKISSIHRRNPDRAGFEAGLSSLDRVLLVLQKHEEITFSTGETHVP